MNASRSVVWQFYDTFHSRKGSTDMRRVTRAVWRLISTGLLEYLVRNNAMLLTYLPYVATG